ncbi:DUF4160 domain-containing protein [Frateuria sp. MAH-13]|uniref:DUF4160 domain-containing protein n=1 Tax=Frateuria flava TaxID=2821489 RepID=A0ABS4DQT5_9GAMM|nr:DUF4160 domain-containing protein [Frateuria flava]MBP1475421.1 DUF4160 domain-containing protein [Frateuria flava]
MNLNDLASKLQKDLGWVDLLTRPSRSSHGSMELLVVKLDRLKIKIYQEKGHSLPHIHVDYGKQHHVATFSIDPPARIEGKLSNKYDRSVQEWLTNNREGIVALWAALQAGESPDALVAELRGDDA